jgi:ABC-type bacteriocin/lantibiotic exporter with double-glycine peptidase domain
MAVPHFYQSSAQTCGVACLRMLFAALGVDRDEATIAQHCGLAKLDDFLAAWATAGYRGVRIWTP